jgi:hypothetical protein
MLGFAHYYTLIFPSFAHIALSVARHYYFWLMMDSGLLEKNPSIDEIVRDISIVLA